MKYDRSTAGPCCLCEAPTTGRFMVNYDNRLGKPIPPDEHPPESGWLPIGSECKRKVPASWVERVRP